jgi:hypothetical protein
MKVNIIRFKAAISRFILWFANKLRLKFNDLMFTLYKPIYIHRLDHLVFFPHLWTHGSSKHRAGQYYFEGNFLEAEVSGRNFHELKGKKIGTLLWWD